MAGTYTIYISALDVEIETEAAGFVEKVIPSSGFGDDKAVGDAIEDDDKVISSPEWSEKVASESEGTHADLTFLLGNDLHMGGLNGAEDADEYYVWAKRTVVAANNIAGEAYKSPLTGTVDTPLFMLNSGDTLDNANDYPTSMEKYLEYYGTDGTDGLLNYPVYTVRGNHDSHAAILSHIVDTHGDYKYRFIANGIHFIVCDTYVQSVADGVNSADSQCSYDWLAEQLSLIGKNDRIVLFQHYDFLTEFGIWGVDPNIYKWWHKDDADALYDLIKDYNIVAILHGHVHATVLPDNAGMYEPFRTDYNINSPYGGTFNVCKITGNTFQFQTWNPDIRNDPGNPGFIGSFSWDADIPAYSTYSEKAIAADGFGNDKEIS